MYERYFIIQSIVQISLTQMNLISMLFRFSQKLNLLVSY